MSANNGCVYFWNRISDYIPPFNFNHFFFNFYVNFSYERIQVFEDLRKCPKNMACFFLNSKLLKEWNKKANEKAKFIFMAIGLDGKMKIYLKK